jgi:hypothetical protein
MSQQKWARAEKEKYVYNALVKKGVPTKEAQKARSLGASTIKERYGVELKKLETKKVDYTLRVDSRGKGLYIKKDYVKPIRKTTKKLDVIDKAFKEQQKALPKRDRDIARRQKLWRVYSEQYDDKMPIKHRQIAQKANLEKGFDINETYGFAIAYYAFLYQISPEEVKKNTDVGKFVPESYVVAESRL